MDRQAGKTGRQTVMKAGRQTSVHTAGCAYVVRECQLLGLSLCGLLVYACGLIVGMTLGLDCL